MKEGFLVAMSALYDCDVREIKVRISSSGSVYIVAVVPEIGSWTSREFRISDHEHPSRFSGVDLFGRTENEIYEAISAEMNSGDDLSFLGACKRGLL